MVIDSLPEKGLLLEGWRFQAGDDPAWAAPELDDSGWQSIDPARNINELGPLSRVEVGWFRLHMQVGSFVAKQALALLITQQGASEIYLQGKLVHRLGVVSKDYRQEVIYNPTGTPLSFPLPAGKDIVLAIRYSFTQTNFRYIVSNWQPLPALVVRLQGMDEAVKSLALERSYVGLREFGKVGYFLVLSLLHLVFFLSYPLRRTNLYFSLATLGNSFGYLAYYYAYFMPHAGVGAYVASSVGNFLEASFCQLMLLCVYVIARQRVGWLFWGELMLMLLSVKFGSFFLPLYVFCFIADAIRVNWRGIQRGIPDSRMGMISWAGYSVLIAGYYLNYFQVLPPSQLALDLFYNGAMLWVTGLFSVLLSRDYGRTNRSLKEKLEEIQTLSGQMRAQEEEKQQRLASENQRLEAQVEKRTQEVGRQNALLAQQAEMLLEQDQLKSRLITNLTHEFRTPLSLIISPVEKLLVDPELPNRVTSLLSVVNRNANQLLSLINQLLDLSKLDAGQMKVTPERTHLVLFLEEILSLFRPQAESKGITLSWQHEAGTGYGLIDRDKWTKILTNLLSNALKYTPTGGQVSVGFQLTAQQARVIIADTGVGIESEKLPLVFERFYQADDSTTRSHEGTGIGLALVKELTDLLKGTVTLTSRIGQGTRIELTLPFQLAESDVKAALSAPATEMLLKSKSDTGSTPWDHTLLPEEKEYRTLVLVVEDNAELREFIKEELSPHYLVLTAQNGAEAWQVAQRELPDIVVSDVMMPLLDGFALTRLIKTDPVTNHIAVVLLTARTARENRLKGLTLGADDYLTKPFHSDELQLRLRNLLAHRQKLQEYFQRKLAAGAIGSTPAEALDAKAFPQLPNPFLEKLYGLLEARLDDSTYGVEELASDVGMSRRSLHRKLKALINLSPQDFVSEYRLRRAADLLRQGRNVSETAYLVGYESASHFSSVFKAFYRKMPSEFIKR